MIDISANEFEAGRAIAAKLIRFAHRVRDLSNKQVHLLIFSSDPSLLDSDLPLGLIGTTNDKLTVSATVTSQFHNTDSGLAAEAALACAAALQRGDIEGFKRSAVRAQMLTVEDGQRALTAGLYELNLPEPDERSLMIVFVWAQDEKIHPSLAFLAAIRARHPDAITVMASSDHREEQKIALYQQASRQGYLDNAFSSSSENGYSLLKGLIDAITKTWPAS